MSTHKITLNKHRFFNGVNSIGLWESLGTHISGKKTKCVAFDQTDETITVLLEN